MDRHRLINRILTACTLLALLTIVNAQLPTVLAEVSIEVNGSLSPAPKVTQVIDEAESPREMASPKESRVSSSELPLLNESQISEYSVLIGLFLIFSSFLCWHTKRSKHIKI